jgi:GntR family negative regulator for fad regulon and positive regulator of fabA
MEQFEKFIKPTQFAEKEIVKSILEGKFKVGSSLPPERELAQLLGITRPTLREVLQRLSRDGWIAIKHGRPTIVNDYQEVGGLGVLKTFVQFSEFTSQKLVLDWLEFRSLILPYLAQKAINKSAEKILSYLENIPTLQSDAKIWAIFDWNLQVLLVKESQNTVALMLYNDLSKIYFEQAQKYFFEETTKKISNSFYKNLKDLIITNPTKIEDLVSEVMKSSRQNWQEIFNVNN